MQIDKIIQKAYKMATGDDESIAQSEPAYSKYISILNDLQRDWYNESIILPNERWASLEREKVISLTNDITYELDGELVRSPLNFLPLRIRIADSQIITPELVSMQEFGIKHKKDIYHVSADGKKISFSTDYIKDFIGSELIYPYYESLRELTVDSMAIVDDVNWLIYMLAAEFARSDIVQAGQYGNLVALAQNSMTSMKNLQRGLRIASMNPWRIKK